MTDQISGTVTLGERAHFMPGGLLCSATADNTSIHVGQWLSTADADGYAKVEINII